MHNKNPTQHKGNQRPKITLDEALAEGYPEVVREAIDKVVLDEIQEYRLSSFIFRFSVRQGTSTVALRAKVRLKKLIAILTGAATVISLSTNSNIDLATAWESVTSFIQRLSELA